MADPISQTKATLEEVTELLKKYAQGLLQENNIGELAKKLVQLSPKELNQAYQGAGVQKEEKSLQEEPVQTLKANENVQNKQQDSINSAEFVVHPSLDKKINETNRNQANLLQNGMLPSNPNILSQNQKNLQNPFNIASLAPNAPRPLGNAKGLDPVQQKKIQEQMNNFKNINKRVTNIKMDANKGGSQFIENHKKIDKNEAETHQELNKEKDMESNHHDDASESSYETPNPFKMRPEPYDS